MKVIDTSLSELNLRSELVEAAMHERERHRVILSAVQERAVVTVQDAMEYTGASEATILTMYRPSASVAPSMV